MATLVLDRRLAEELREQRVAAGSDRWDEVWEGTYMMTPLPNIEHQELVSGFVSVIRDALGHGRAIVLPGTNVSDRETGWEHNYRCPDVAVYFADNPAINCDTHWRGGPDFAVEIVSDDDRSREKLPFYASVGTREILIVDRDPWGLELLRLKDGRLISVGISTSNSPQIIESQTLPLSFCLTDVDDRPAIKAVHLLDGRSWDV
jgi:Uma2 family endonuclease